MKIKILIMLIILPIFGINAQSAREILDQANRAFINAGGITANFTINTEDIKGKTTYSQDGKSLLKGNKFKIDVPDGITWFDGKTQWVHANGSDEVNVSNPSGEELAAVSPSTLLNIYKTGFKLNYKGEKKENGKSVYVIELIPESKKSEFNKMIVTLDKDTYLFSSIKLSGKNGINNSLTVKKIQTKKNLSDNSFVFDKKLYPNIEIIDLR